MGKMGWLLQVAPEYAKDHHARTIGIAGFDGGALKTMTDACVVVSANSTPYVESWHATLNISSAVASKRGSRVLERSRRAAGP